MATPGRVARRGEAGGEQIAPRGLLLFKVARALFSVRIRKVEASSVSVQICHVLLDLHDSRMKVMNADRHRQLSKDETSGLIIVFRGMNVGDVLVTRSFGWLDLVH